MSELWQRHARWLLPIAAALLLLAVWQIYVATSGVSDLVMPSPHEVIRALVDDRGTLWSNLGPTAEEILLGMLVATAAGLVTAVAVHWSGVIRHATLPLVVASQAIPVVILAPILILWLGFGLLPKVLVVALVCFFPVLVTTLSGLETVDPELIKLMRTFDASRRERFRRIELPSALPGLFTGAKLAAVFSVVGAVVAEWAGSNSGLGYLITVTLANQEPAEAFASVFVLSAFAILLFALLSLLERRALPWAYQTKEIPSR